MPGTMMRLLTGAIENGLMRNNSFVFWVTLAAVLSIISCKSKHADLQDELFKAVESGHIQKVLNLTSANPELLNAQDKRGLPLLQVAISLKKNPLALELIKAGVEIDGRDKFGNTHLICALYFHNHEVSSALLKAGANPNIANGFKQTPLYWAIANHVPEELFDLLVESGAVIQDESLYRGSLVLAVRNGNEFDVKRLIELGMDVNKRTKDSELPLLFLSMESNQFKVFSLLLEKGADHRATGKDGETVWMFAMSQPDPDRYLAKLLEVEPNPDLSVLDTKGASALSYAVWAHKEKYIELTLKKGGDLSKIRLPVPGLDHAANSPYQPIMALPYLQIIHRFGPNARFDCWAGLDNKLNVSPVKRTAFARYQIKSPEVALALLEEWISLRDYLAFSQEFKNTRSMSDTEFAIYQMNLLSDPQALLLAVTSREWSGETDQILNDTLALHISETTWLAGMMIRFGWIKEEEAVKLLEPLLTHVPQLASSWTEWYESVHRGMISSPRAEWRGNYPELIKLFKNQTDPSHPAAHLSWFKPTASK